MKKSLLVAAVTCFVVGAGFAPKSAHAKVRCGFLELNGTWKNEHGDIFKITQNDPCAVQFEDVQNQITYKINLSDSSHPEAGHSESVPEKFIDTFNKNESQSPAFTFAKHYIKEISYVGHANFDWRFGNLVDFSADVSGSLELPVLGRKVNVQFWSLAKIHFGEWQGKRTIQVGIQQVGLYADRYTQDAYGETYKVAPRNLLEHIRVGFFRGLNSVVQFLHGGNELLLNDSKLTQVK